MPSFQNYSNSHRSSSILLSIKPKFANLIVEGSKLVELRRAIPAQRVGTIAIYSSSPVQSIVALVDIKEIIEATLANLWLIVKENGGGLSKEELFSYFKSKSLGFALMLENVRVFKKPVDPNKILEHFFPPQSFKYLTTEELQKLEKILEKEKFYATKRYMSDIEPFEDLDDLS